MTRWQGSWVMALNVPYDRVPKLASVFLLRLVYTLLIYTEKKFCKWVFALGSSTSKSFFKDWKCIIESTLCLRISLFCYGSSCKSLIFIFQNFYFFRKSRCHHDKSLKFILLPTTNSFRRSWVITLRELFLEIFLPKHIKVCQMCCRESNDLKFVKWNQ